MEKQPFQGFFTKGVMRNFAEIICAGIPFLIFSCEFCEICKNTFFEEQHRTTASDYSSVNSSEESIGKKNCAL